MTEKPSFHNGRNNLEKEQELTLSELMRLELAGKHEATGRYESVIWKIRSGYVVALYGALALLTGKHLDIHDLHLEHILLVCAFSLIAYLMDRRFRISQLKVVVARDQLIDQAMRYSRREPVDVELVRSLLHIAGESQESLDKRLEKKELRPLKLLYAITPVLVTVSYLIARMPALLKIMAAMGLQISP